jgi:AraC family transcriptional activator FtrA
MIRVAILIDEQAALFELGCAVELFGLPRPEYPRWYECDVVSFSDGPHTVTGGLQVQAKSVERLDDYDMLVIPSWSVEVGDPDERLAQELRRFEAAGKRLLSFCSGAFLLAALGFLDGRDTTTHWRYAEKFRQRFPAARYLDDVLYVYDDRIGCSAGSAAGIDLGIEVIRRDFGYRIANQVARRLVISAHRKGGQSQFVETTVPEHPRQFAAALDWALANLRDVGDIDMLARRANMSRRTFDRRFRATFSLTPNAWLVMQKLDLAKGLLEEGTESVETIAGLSGFGNAITMRHHFRRLAGVSPREYQAQFHAATRES